MKRPRMCLSKEWLIRMIKKYGHSNVLDEFEGTDEEAIKLLEDDPRIVFTENDVIGQPDKEK